MPTKNGVTECWWCGGRVTKKLAEREYRWKGKLYIFRNVPMGVCDQCGEKFVSAGVVKKMEKIVTEGKKVTKKLVVPIYSL